MLSTPVPAARGVGNQHLKMSVVSWGQMSPQRFCGSRKSQATELQESLACGTTEPKLQGGLQEGPATITVTTALSV